MQNSQSTFSLTSSEDLQRIEEKLDKLLLIASAPAPQETPAIYTHEKAAEFLTISRFTLYDKVSKGEIKATRKGNRSYYLLEDLLAYINSGQKG